MVNIGCRLFVYFTLIISIYIVIIYLYLQYQEGLVMTVATQVKETIAGLRGVQASFEQFALQTENQQAKQMYSQAAQQTEAILESVQQRMQDIEQEEPQYKQM